MLQPAGSSLVFFGIFHGSMVLVFALQGLGTQGKYGGHTSKLKETPDWSNIGNGWHCCQSSWCPAFPGLSPNQPTKKQKTQLVGSSSFESLSTILGPKGNYRSSASIWFRPWKTKEGTVVNSIPFKINRGNNNNILQQMEVDQSGKP